MGFWQQVSPRGAVTDLVNEWRKPNPYRWQVLTLSVALTFTMMMVFLPKSERAPPERPKVTYISTFEPGRTDAEIEASNLANQKKQDALAAEQEKIDQRRREAAKALGSAMGMDVDAMEKRILAEQAEEKAAEERARAAARATAAGTASGR